MTRAAINNPTLVTTLMTLPTTTWVGADPNRPTAADRKPAFLTSTHGFLDSVIASPATRNWPGSAAK